MSLKPPVLMEGNNIQEERNKGYSLKPTSSSYTCIFYAIFLVIILPLFLNIIPFHEHQWFEGHQQHS